MSAFGTEFFFHQDKISKIKYKIISQKIKEVFFLYLSSLSGSFSAFVFGV